MCDGGEEDADAVLVDEADYERQGHDAEDEDELAFWEDWKGVWEVSLFFFLFFSFLPFLFSLVVNCEAMNNIGKNDPPKVKVSTHY